MSRWRVGIIGGGPGGLMTAYLLQKYANNPFRLTLFEASRRLGGKLETGRFQSAPASYEIGAAELYDYSPVDEDPLRLLIAELGLSINPMGGSAVILGDETLANLDDVRDRLGPAARRELEQFDRTARDWMSPAEFFVADQVDLGRNFSTTERFDSVLSKIADPALRRFVEVFIHSDLATEPRRTSVAYGLQNYLMNDSTYMQLYCIEGGNERLPRELAGRIEGDFRLGHRVTHVSRTGDGRLRVDFLRLDQLRLDQAEEGFEHFDFVVAALPNNFLPTLSFAPPELAAAIGRHHSHYDHPAHYLRITLLFAEPFWRGALSDSYWMLDKFGGCCLYDESSREPGSIGGVLGWLLAGDAALETSALSDEELIDLALESLPGFLSQGRELFREGRVHRWVAAVNAIPGGLVQQPLDQRHRPDPSETPNLFVVGDYLFDSTLNGVLDSAEHVAQWLAALLAESPRVPQ